MKLLSPGSSNHKIAKGNLKKYESAVLHLAPHTLAGGKTVCPHSSVQCRATCLYWAGRGRMPQVIEARIEKTKLYLQNSMAFLFKLEKELDQLTLRSIQKRRLGVVRLDGTSDLDLGGRYAPHYKLLKFYDYTKDIMRYTRWLGHDRYEHPNRYLTFSRSENNWSYCPYFLHAGGTVTVVFWPRIPKTWQGFKVIDGDKHDFRFLDPPGVIVGLLAKGKAKKLADPSGKGFVVQV